MKPVSTSALRRVIALDYGRLKPLLLTNQEREVLDVVRRQEECSSHFIAWKLGVSTQHASNILYKLYRKGYVDRAQIPQKSGGYEYEYTSTTGG